MVFGQQQNSLFGQQQNSLCGISSISALGGNSVNIFGSSSATPFELIPSSTTNVFGGNSLNTNVVSKDLKLQPYSPQLDTLEPEETKNAMESILDILKCPVCLVLVKKDSIYCVNGHATCKKCLGLEKSCPKCRCSISNLQQNVIISQILEVIPHRCRFDECSHVVKSGEDHEVYCRFRQTQCKYSGCSWVGSVDKLHIHVKEQHPQETVFSKKKNVVKVSKYFFDSNATLLFSAGGHYFWQIKEKNVDSVKFIYLPLWIGKPNHDIYMRILLKSEEDEKDQGIKIKKNQTNDWVFAAKANLFIFPASIISNFFNGNELEYHLLITEDRNEAVNMMLE